MSTTLSRIDPSCPSPAIDSRCVHEVIADMAARTPDRTAVELREQRLSYGELNARANQLAGFLQTLGVGPEVLVGISLPRSPAFVTAVLGILKAGGAFFPFDPDYPKRRLAAMLEAADVSILVTDTPSAEAVRPNVKRVVLLDQEGAAIARESRANTPNGATVDNLAYVIFTSGSTGQPKGTMVTHRNLSFKIPSFAARFGMHVDDVHSFMSPISFSASLREYLWPLCAGARVVVAPPEGIRDAVAFMETVKRAGVTVLHSVPSHLRALSAALLQLDPERRTRLLANSVRMVFVGGEPLHPDVAAAWLGLEHRAALIFMYGLTETAGVIAFYEIEKKDLGSKLPIGPPMANTTLYILDDSLQLVPIGMPGELYVGGPTVARGYRNNPKASAERFVRDPYTDDPAARLHRTGDLARTDGSGKIELLGRIDDEVKIRGFKIRPEEIRANLSQHPSIAGVVVSAGEDAAGEKRLLAYILSKPGTITTSAALRSFLKERVPEYMVPSLFVKLDALPLLPSGKVDRSALPGLDKAVLLLEREYIAPTTEIEKGIAAIWADLLRIDRTGVHDTFFELGGDSISGMQIIARINNKFSVDLPLELIFTEPTISELARRVESGRSTKR